MSSYKKLAYQNLLTRILNIFIHFPQINISNAFMYSRFIIDRFNKFLVLKAASVENENHHLRNHIEKYQDTIIESQNENHKLKEVITEQQEKIQQLIIEIAVLENNELTYMLESCSIDSENTTSIYESQKHTCKCVIL
jgi:septal ring factor EnvC (AmiA/AmiB activator)